MSSVFAGPIAAGARALTGATARWIDVRPDARQRVYFANHTSHLDFVVLWSVLPRWVRQRCRPVAARDYWCSGWRRRIAVNVFNAILVERRGKLSPDPLQAASATLDVLLDALGQRNSLIIFPEGTRGTGETIGPFRSGIYHLWSQRPDVEFVPVYLANLNRVLPKGEFLVVPFISRVVFGPPLHLQAGESKESFLAQAHAALCALKEA
jgi:1-acyl-sn-glycerol-3-phosphate acyltransferase